MPRKVKKNRNQRGAGPLSERPTCQTPHPARGPINPSARPHGQKPDHPHSLNDIDWDHLAREADFRPSVMADLCPISLRQMERFFSDHFGKTPTEWVRHFRCRLARQLILQGWSSKAVVAELHFADHAHLCHDFKKVYGVAPQTYAPRYRTKHKPQAADNPSPSATP